MAIDDRPVAPARGDAALGADTTIDWERAEGVPEFQELVRRRRAFIVPATAFFMAWYFGFVILCGYAPDFMGKSLVDDLTVGYALALSQFVMVWGLGWLYLRKADRVFDPLAERAARAALELSREGVAGARPLDTARVTERSPR